MAHIADGQVFKVGKKHLAEFVEMGNIHERAWRVVNHAGMGIVVEGEEIEELIDILMMTNNCMCDGGGSIWHRHGEKCTSGHFGAKCRCSYC